MKKENEIRIKINDVDYDIAEKIDHVISSLFEFFQSQYQYQYMSADAIKENMKTIIELVEDLTKKKEGFLLVKLSATTKKSINFMKDMIDNAKNKESLLTFIMNFILTQEGCGLMRGFGCAKALKRKVTAWTKINPERQRMSIERI